MPENTPPAAAPQQAPKDAPKDAELAVAWPWQSLTVDDVKITREWTQVPGDKVARAKAHALAAGCVLRDKAVEDAKAKARATQGEGK